MGGEACDDGNALASGGCNASCSAVTTGWACGEGASGCHVAPVDAGSPDSGTSNGVDAGTQTADAGADPQPTQTQGCSTTSGPLLALLLALVVRKAR